MGADLETNSLAVPAHHHQRKRTSVPVVLIALATPRSSYQEELDSRTVVGPVLAALDAVATLARTNPVGLGERSFELALSLERCRAPVS